MNHLELSDMISVSGVCLQVAVITLLKIVLIGGFSSHLRLSLRNYKIDYLTRSEYHLHSIDPSIHLDEKYITDKDYDDKNNNSGIRGKKYMNYNLVKTALMKYKEIYGNMLVTGSFIVPKNSTDFPEEFWEMKLGGHVNTIRNNNAYAEHKDELIALGFDYGSQKFTYYSVKLGLLKFKEIYGNMLVTQSFIIPTNSSNFPEECWEMRLGVTVQSIRNSNAYAEHKDELMALGFDYRSQHSTYDSVKLALLKYKEIYGNMLVTQSFIIPTNSSDFPEECWEMKLGINVNSIRSQNAYAEHKDDLIALGFDYGSQIPTYDFVKLALLKYKEIYGNMLVTGTFIIPTNSSDFPEEFWEMRLGGTVSHIRSQNGYAEHKDELIALGFDFEYQNFIFDEVMTALLRFKQIHGDLLVPMRYVISPDDTDYPEEVRGMKLGSCVNYIRSGGHLQKKEELLAIGFVYVVRKRFDYETVRIATFKYRELHHGSTKISLKYKIPVDSTWYPEETWGISLGSILYRVRTGKKWPDKYSELFS
jgi:hypothetical protein